MPNKNEINNIASIIKFKELLIKEIPYYPNNGESKEFLLKIDIGTLINIHDSWKERTIIPLPRKIIIPDNVKKDPLYKKNKPKIVELLRMIEKGSDISDYQSKKVKKNTFNVDDFKQTKSFMNSRDQMLVCEGVYHLHLQAYPARTNEVLLAQIDNNNFYLMGIFTHKVFESNNAEEDIKYDHAIRRYIATKAPQGGAMFLGLQNMAGSSFVSSINQTHIIKILTLVEKYHDGISPYTKFLYKRIHDRTPMSVSPLWRINQRTIEIYDRKNSQVFDSNEIWSYIYEGIR